MKILNLLELINSEYNEVESKNRFDLVKGVKLRQKHILGDSKRSGADGRVYPTGDPHIITKVNHSPISPYYGDGYMTWAKYLIDNNIADSNPFAPRMYKMDVIKDAKGMARYKIKMETLQRVDSVDEEILTRIYINLYDEMARRHIAKAAPYLNRIDKVLAKAIDMTAEMRIKSTNSLLTQLCVTINKLCNKCNGSPDIHGNNIMVRLGKAPQIVIIDPIATDGSSS